MNNVCVCNNYRANAQNMHNPNFTGINRIKSANGLRLVSDAKKSCIEALKSNKPFERGILIETKSENIVSRTDGTKTDVPVKIPYSLFKTHDYSLIHGHTTLTDKKGGKYTLPVSFTDFELMNNNKELSEVIAINEHGKETILEKTGNFRTLKESQIDELKKQYLKAMYDNLCTDAEKAQIKSIYNYTLDHPDTPALKQNLINKLLDKQYSEEGGNVITQFFRDIADKIGLKFTEK